MDIITYKAEKITEEYILLSFNIFIITSLKTF